MGSIVHRSVPTNLKWFPTCSHAHAMFQDRFKDVQVGSRWFSTLYILSPNFYITLRIQQRIPLDLRESAKQFSAVDIKDTVLSIMSSEVCSILQNWRSAQRWHTNWTKWKRKLVVVSKKAHLPRIFICSTLHVALTKLYVFMNCSVKPSFLPFSYIVHQIRSQLSYWQNQRWTMKRRPKRDQPVVSQPVRGGVGTPQLCKLMFS